MRRLFPILLALALPAPAQTINAPSILYRDPKFLKDFVGSYGILSDVEPKISADEQALLGKVQDLFGKNQFIAAEQEVVRFVKETEAPTDPEKKPGEISATMVFVLGNLYFASDRTDEARRAFNEAIRRFPRFRRAHTNLGLLHISKNELAQALPVLQKAVELGETSPRVYGMMGYCYMQDKNALAAENAYRQAYLLDPQNRDWKVGLTQALVQQERLEEATSMLNTMITENPEDRQLWLQQANALIGQEKKMEAAVNLEVLRLKGQASESELNLLGNIYMEQGEAQLALFAYLEAIEKAPKLDVQRALKSARILNEYGYPEKAEAFVERVAKMGGLSATDLLELDLVRVKIARSSNDVAKLGTLLRDLFKRDPGNAEVLLELAKHHDDLAKNEADEAKRGDDLGEAKVHYKLALEKPAVAYQANLGMGQLLVREKQYTEAMPYIERALSLKTGDKASLEQYISRVRRAADRENQRKEREAKERAEADEAAKKPK
ncbi:tetratricopeptide repeat protein [Luteolibacter sp. GHJ8]|uniref:Tetratricopeptide repeat protein n=1 Tax=Luteolibacter rhizosphaerae TaxID=2989719 RepID=A0ABT3FXX9_9BACT|nr:tetratricopeptide repeat protein [Luteolibacter rhizosphaerae]MCW1912204.1 tetratricopeptide repeat protein [Luteolibacter rhizosphaerae]